MFETVDFATYGRFKMLTDWYIYPTTGINRLYYVHSGTATYTGSGKDIALLPGRVYIFPQNLDFTLSMKGSNGFDHTFFDFFCTPSLIMNHFAEIVMADYPLINDASQGLFSIVGKYPMATAPHSCYRNITASYFNCFMKIIDTEVGIDIMRNPLINELTEYIHTHFTEEISITELAKKYHLEKNVLIRKFKKYTGTTPYQYIKNHRLAIATSLIRNSSLTLDEIALKTGYHDASSLSHAIKRISGFYPGKLPKVP